MKNHRRRKWEISGPRGHERVFCTSISFFLSLLSFWNLGCSFSVSCVVIRWWRNKVMVEMVEGGKWEVVTWGNMSFIDEPKNDFLLAYFN